MPNICSHPWKLVFFVLFLRPRGENTLGLGRRVFAASCCIVSAGVACARGVGQPAALHTSTLVFFFFLLFLHGSAGKDERQKCHQRASRPSRVREVIADDI